MGSKKIKSGTGFWSAMVSWFTSFGSVTASGSSNKRDRHGAPSGMIVAAKHFSTAHSVKFG
ncbi:hypothetical protein BS78_02G099300 [Paspalum vaginatum]|nr:hypothetical protein BS78_02G075600 [Paspalum vaginatum]KAJ1288589.1 hypothetical protein BS78_02G099300 [Paspalum vaginatum]